MQSPESQKVVDRFFEALKLLAERKVIRGKKTFTEKYGINRWNLLTLEKDRTRDIFQVAWLSYLVDDFGMSALWLLTGRGEPFAAQNKSGRQAEIKEFKPSLVFHKRPA